MALIRSFATVGGYTALSRILGFVREILIANFVGAIRGNLAGEITFANNLEIFDGFAQRV